MLDMTLVEKYPLRDFASSSKCMAIACLGSTGTEMFPIPDFNLTYTVVQQGKVCECIILCSLFHTGSSFVNAFGFSSASMMLTLPPASVDLDD